jgi:membrane protease YdiL (CAAX protease family)
MATPLTHAPERTRFSLNPGCTFGAVLVTALLLSPLLPEHHIQAGLFPALYLLVLAPAIEELFFRLGVQETLYRRVPQQTWIAPLGATAAFALAHALMQPSSLLLWYFAPAGALALLHHHARSRSQTLGFALCALMHSSFNGIWMLTASATIH